MSPIESKILGKEQLILLPAQSQVFNLTTDPPGQVQMQTGMHAVVVSGYIGLSASMEQGLGAILATDDDEIIYDWEVHQAIGPLWRSIQQVSASVSPSGIASIDADEVDQARWVVTECTWDEVAVEGGKKIRLNVKLEIQGEGNGWISLAYQVVATGNLRRMPTPDEISADLT